MEEFLENEEQEQEELLESTGFLGKLKGMSKKQLIIIVIVFLLLFFCMIFISLFSDDEEEKKTLEDTGFEKIEVFETKYKKIIYYDQLTIDLSDSDPKRFLVLKIAIEVGSGKIKEDMQGRVDEVNEAILILLEQKSFYDLRTVDGKLLLKKELIKKFNDIFGTGKVRNIYFNKFIMHKLES
ncbi:MAG: hypothetical protein GY714_32525 [Desulfobacterales bacterium]|nr:hypothetical protein [Desulfobacterales bacterium]MCP4161725.1 hypothetical protein [Deltaproteobacteria bacterium]